MSFFRNIRIRTKIFSICFILLAIMILSGWVSFNSMTGIQANLDAIFKVRMPGIDFLIEADRDLQQLLVAERSLVFADPGGEATCLKVPDPGAAALVEDELIQP